MKRTLTIRTLCLTAVIVASHVSAALAEKRVALVIGNSSYAATADLKNPQRDANAVADKLRSMGFQVTTGTNQSLNEMRDTVRDFTVDAWDADLSLFYYAGHGISVDGKSYLVPVDARLDHPVKWQFEVYDVNEILRLVDNAPGPSVILLDACRDNPLAQVLAQSQGMTTRSLSSRGIERIPTEQLGVTGNVIGYATEPGQVAKDGDGLNSPFATALVRHIGTANTDFATLTSLITRDVLEMTGQSQQPRFDISLTGPLVLNKVDALPAVQTTEPTAAAAAPAQTGGDLSIQKLMFESARGSDDVLDYQAYLDAFPNGVFAAMARNAISRKQRASEPEQSITFDLSALQPQAHQPQVQQPQVQQQPAVAPQPQATRMINAPLQLVVTPTVRAMPSSTMTETALGLDNRQSRAVQLRLNLSGHNVGTVDGNFGNKTRTGLRGWQTQNGLYPTGYLNAVQHQLLVSQTESAFRMHLQTNPNALTAPARRSGSSGKRKSSKSYKPGYLEGVMTGVGLGVLLK